MTLPVEQASVVSDRLAAADHAEEGGAGGIQRGAAREVDVVGLRGARHDVELGLGVPVRDAIEDALWVGDVGVDHVSHGGFGPLPRVGGIEEENGGQRLGRFAGGGAARGLRLGGGADDDVALDDGEPAADLVADQAAIEVQRADFRRARSGRAG